MKRYLFPLAIVLLLICRNAAPAERLAVTGSVANIRSGPGTEHRILWKVGKYYPLLILERSGKWLRFRDFEGDEGWIHESLAGKVATVITKGTSNIRSGPGTSFKVLATIGKGIPFKVIERKGDWIHIEHADGDKGWIHKNLVW